MGEGEGWGDFRYASPRRTFAIKDLDARPVAESPYWFSLCAAFRSRCVAAGDALALQHDDVETAPADERALLEHDVAEAKPAADLEEARAD